MLRAVTRQRLLQVVEDSFFGAQNFDVVFRTEGRAIVEIQFLPQRQFQFLVSPPNDHGRYKVVEAPGHKFTTPESQFTSDFDVVLEWLDQWMVRVREEVVASNPFARELSTFRQQVEARLEGMGDELNTFFTNEEAADLDVKLQAFAKKIDDLVKDNEELSEAVSNLRNTVADLQESMQVVDKGTWYRMSAGRMLSALKAVMTSKEARTLALEAARKFLLEGPK